MSYNQLRSNIRNAWIAESSTAILEEWHKRLLKGDLESATYLRELIKVAMDEEQYFAGKVVI